MREAADFVGSTAQIERYARDAMKEKYIVGTEDGLVHKITRDGHDE